MGIVREFSSTIFRVQNDGVNPISPADDFWYSRPGMGTDSGMRVSPESAMQLAAVFACIRVITETLASLPLIIYKKLPDGGKERALDHPLYKILHNRPNIYQTGFEFVEMMQGHLELRGNAFAEICPGPAGAIDSLVPIHPDRVQVYRLPNGRLRYQVRAWYDGSLKNYAMEEIFHVRGLSSDGMVGMSPVAVQREMIGVSLAQQEYAARFFANDAQPRGIYETPQKLSPEAYKRLRETLQDANTGANRHKAALLEEGLKYTAIGLNNRDSQFLEARQYSIGEIARMFRVPPHKIGDLSKATFSNIEQQAIEFVVDCMRPRAVRWEQRIQTELLDPLDLGDGNEYFAEFLMDALLRGDLKSRYEAYNIGRNGGWLTPNDVCRMENRNPIPAEKGGDDYLRPTNMAVATDEPAPDPPAQDPPDDDVVQEDGDAVNARLEALAIGAGERIVRKESAALRKALARTAGNLEKFKAAANDFYVGHTHFVAETMKIDESAALRYVTANLNALLSSTDEASATEKLASIELNCPLELARVAIGEQKK